MKSILLIALGLQLALGNVCLMPMTHAQISMGHGSTMMTDAHCTDCTDVSTEPAHCPGGHCVISAGSIEENTTPVAGTITAIVTAPIASPPYPSVSDGYIDIDTAAPPPKSHTDTIVLQL